MLLFWLAACAYHDAPVQDGVRMSFSQTEGKSITTVADPILQVWVKTISDSRCPIGLYCIWGGEASVTFEVVSSEYSLKVFSLKIGESIVFTDNQRSYKLTLKDVTPFPSTTNANEVKTAMFTLEKL